MSRHVLSRPEGSDLRAIVEQQGPWEAGQVQQEEAERLERCS